MCVCVRAFARVYASVRASASRGALNSTPRYLEPVGYTPSPHPVRVVVESKDEPNKVRVHSLVAELRARVCGFVSVHRFRIIGLVPSHTLNPAPHTCSTSSRHPCSPTWEAHTVKRGCEWYQPTTLSGSPVRAARSCTRQLRPQVKIYIYNIYIYIYIYIYK